MMPAEMDDTVFEDERRDTRRRMSIADFVPAGTDPVQTKALVKRLADEVLVVTSRNKVTGEDEVEVAHEALIRHWGRLRTWLDNDSANLRLRKSITGAAKEWENHPSDESLLIHHGSRLEAAEDLIHRRLLLFTGPEAEYIKACVAVRERKNAEAKLRTKEQIEAAQQKQRAAEADAEKQAALRRESEQITKNKLRVIGFSSLLLLAGIILVFLLRRSSEQEHLNRSAVLISESRATLVRSPSTTLKLAIEAVQSAQDTRTAQLTQAINNLRSTVITTRSRAYQLGHKGINTISVSPNQQWIASSHDDGAVMLCPWPLSNAPSSCILLRHQNPVTSVSFDATSHWLLTSTDHRWSDRVADISAAVWEGADKYSIELFLWDLSLKSSKPVPLKLDISPGMARTFALSSDGHWLAVGCEDGRVLFWKPSGQCACQAHNVQSS